MAAELERLTVPVSRVEPKPAKDAGRQSAHPDGKTDRDIAAEAEEIRQMIEASYT